MIRVRCLLEALSIVVVGLLVSPAVVGASGPKTAAPPSAKEGCASLLPPELDVALSRTFATARVVTLADLDAEAQVAFTKFVGHGCPGIVHVDFFGTKADAYGILLIVGTGEHVRSQLVLASHGGSSSQWSVRSLTESGEGPRGNVPFLAKDEPGDYVDVYGEKKIRAMGEVLVWTQGNHVVIVVGWTGKDVDKVWLRD